MPHQSSVRDASPTAIPHGVFPAAPRRAPGPEHAPEPPHDPWVNERPVSDGSRADAESRAAANAVGGLLGFFARAYGQLAFGVIVLIVIFQLMVKPLLADQRANIEVMARAAEAMRQTAADLRVTADTFKDRR